MPRLPFVPWIRATTGRVNWRSFMAERIPVAIMSPCITPTMLKLTRRVRPPKTLTMIVLTCCQESRVGVYLLIFQHYSECFFDCFRSCFPACIEEIAGFSV